METLTSKILFIILLFTGSISFAQEDAWVYFKDKPNAEFYFTNPLEMLSQKALDRRIAQGVALDDKDVPVHEPYIAGIASIEGITIMARSKWLNALHIRGSQEVINALQDLDYVERLDFANKTLNTSGRMANSPQDEGLSKMLEAEAEFSYGTSATQVEMLNGHLLHEQDYTGTGITIAVLDAGFPGVDTTAPFKHLRDNNLILGGYNYVDQSDDFYTGGTHGTLVLSTMGGFVEGQLVGTAPDAFYYLFVTEDPLSENPVEESYWVEAAERADSLGVDVINTSLGYFRYDNPAYNYSYKDINGATAFITRGANVAFTRGIFCVTSAGNAGNTTTPNIGVPSDAFNTLTVGAVDASEVYAGFSSVGPTADGRIKPDVMARGSQATIANTSGSITSANGTSFSSPITAGLVACLWQALPEKTNAELLQLIKQSANRYSAPGPKYGYGIPDFNLALQTGMGITDSPEDTFKVYPNPSKDVVNIVFPKEIKKATVTVFNSLGQLVIEKEILRENANFSIAPLAQGIYSYRITTASVSYTGRLIKE